MCAARELSQQADFLGAASMKFQWFHATTFARIIHCIQLVFMLSLGYEIKCVYTVFEYCWSIGGVG